MLDVDGLRGDLDRLAERTWGQIVLGDRRGMRVREDSITDFSLLELAGLHPDVHVHRYTQNAEAHSGADWEWWLTAGGHWLCLRIQAKRVDGDYYRYLDHPGRSPGAYQYDTLIDRCAADGPWAHALYVFYNGWAYGWPQAARWGACPWGVQVPAECTHGPITRYGCAFARAADVRAIHQAGGPKRGYAPDHLSKSLPWSDLFRPLLSGRPRLDTLIDLGIWLSTDVPLTPNPKPLTGARRLDYVTRTAPEYVQQVLEGGRFLTMESEREHPSDITLDDWRAAYLSSQGDGPVWTPGAPDVVVVADLGE